MELRTIRLNPWIGFVLGWVAVSASPAFALTNIKKIDIRANSEFVLNLDNPLPLKQVVVDYLDEIIQLTLTNTAIYPAKILPVDKGNVKKIFAYQYTPSTVRCRFSMRGRAEDFRNGVRLTASGKVLRVHLERKTPPTETIPPEIVTTLPAVSDSEAVAEKALLQEVVGTEPLSGKGQRLNESDVQQKEIGVEPKAKEREKERSLAGAKPLASIWGAFGKTMGLLGIVLFALFFFRKFGRTLGQRFGSRFGLEKMFRGNDLSLSGGQGFKGIMESVAQTFKAKMGPTDRVIEVVSTHYLDPKKYIAVVKVKGRFLVLGVANESISLITRMNPAGEEAQEGENGFDHELESLASNLSEEKSETEMVSSAIRSRVRSRLEGLKPL